MQNVGIVGLGLIGGSLAKTIKLHTPYTVYGTDKNADTLRRAFLMEAIDGELTAETLPQCDVVLICLYPQGIIDYVTTHAADFKPDSLVIDCGGVKIGGKQKIAVMAGPCSIESEEQITYCAQRVKDAGASLLRGGAFKPRTSPYSFQGMGTAGLDLLMEARKQTGLPIVTEIMDPRMAELFEREVDVVQVGARNMQNFQLLKAVGKMHKPVLLKRGLCNTIEEWIMSAEYIMAGGNEQVILCERGIRTFEKYTRNTLDLSAVPIVHEKTHLPVIVDPSHATGKANLVEPMMIAAVAAGADGLEVEVHYDPRHAWSDGAQCLTPDAFAQAMAKCRQVAWAIGRDM